MRKKTVKSADETDEMPKIERAVAHPQQQHAAASEYMAGRIKRKKEKEAKRKARDGN